MIKGKTDNKIIRYIIRYKIYKINKIIKNYFQKDNLRN